MADQSTCTPALNDQGDPLVDFDVAAAMDFDALDFDPESLPTADQLNNPYMVSVRIAAMTVRQTKGELIDTVVSLGGDRDDGGEMPEIVAKLRAAQELFSGFVNLLKAADSRLFIATCASVS